MNIAILGAGSVGGSLLKKLANGQNKIVIGTRDPNSDKIKSLLEHPNTTAKSHLEAVNESEVVIVALHPPHI